jgi:hypothetical protein
MDPQKTAINACASPLTGYRAFGARNSRRLFMNEPNEALKSQFTAIESRLESHEKATTQHFEELSKSLSERLDLLSEKLANKEEALINKLSAKDNTVEFVREMSATIQRQNDALQKQISGRWTIATGMTGFIALAFAINFTYGIYQVSEARNAKLALEEGGRILAENAVTYSLALGELAYAEPFIAQAYREIQRTGPTLMPSN